ncbi:hypothetical protein [Salibacterium halotolerans]|uniref:Uncharacterized protein n=1 Tax=Salibacterium halotolerans TaxID=1884432 RepID=A0A1I5NVD1_9BACI|nr:hypothetical protein [Salibacterium halotolerans]SFP25722.1 hypothetical protein SAMN05518683_103292 [Salibacterium halotolerans]
MFIKWMLLFLLLVVFTLLFFQWQRIKKLESHQKAVTVRLETMQEMFTDKEMEEEKEEVRHQLHMKALEIRNTVYKQTKGPHPQAVHYTPTTSGFKVEYLDRLFGPERAQKMMQLFEAYQAYVQAYWKTENGRIRTVFRKDQSGSGHSEVEELQAASRNLVNELDELLYHFH